MTGTYDCNKCPGFCCSYQIIEVEPHDITRLAGGLSLTNQEVTDKYLDGWSHRYLKHTSDPLLEGGPSCVFLDKETRQCTVYDYRPDGCREYPYTSRCQWWDRHEMESGLAGKKVIMIKEVPWKGKQSFGLDYDEDAYHRLKQSYGVS